MKKYFINGYLKEAQNISILNCKNSSKNDKKNARFLVFRSLQLSFLAMLFILTLSSCEKLQDYKFLPERVAQVLSIKSVLVDGQPINFRTKAIDISTSPVITLNFSNDISAEKLREVNILDLLKNTDVQNSIQIPFSITQGTNSKQIILTVDKPLIKNADYALNLAKDLSIDIEGKIYKLFKNAVLKFSTQPE